MPRDVDIGIRLNADAKGFSGTLRIAGKDLDRFASAGRKAAKGVDATGAAARRAAPGLGGLAAKLKAVHGRMLLYAGGAGVVAGVSRAIAAFGRHVVDSGLAMERWESRLRAATGSSAGAAAEIRFLRGETERLGLDFSTAADNYSNFLAAAKGTALEGQKSREIYTGVAEAIAVMRLNAGQSEGVFTALTQIMSKGVVSAEELRQQLGDRLTGAFQAAARAMGLSTKEFNKLLASGKLMSEEFLPKLAAELRRTYGAEVPAAAESATAEFARFRNSIDDVGIAVAQSGLLGWLGDVAGKTAEIIRELSGLDASTLTPSQRVQRRLDELQAEEDRGDFDWSRLTAPLRSNPRLEEIDRLRGLAPQNIDATVRRLSQEVEAAQAHIQKYVPEVRVEAVLAGEDNSLWWGTVSARFADLREQLEEALEIRRELLGIGEFAPAKPVAEPKDEPPKEEPDGQSQAEALVAAYRRRVEEQERRDLTNVQRARIEIAALNEDPETAVDAGQAQAVLDAAAALDAFAAAREKAEQAAADQAAAEEAATEALSLYGEAAAQVTHLEQAEALIKEAGTALAEDQAAAIRASAEAKDAEAVATERLNAELEEERRLRESRDLADGAKRALRDYGEAATDAASNIEGALAGAFHGAEDALVGFLRTGEADFSQFVDSLIADLARLVIRQQILGPLAKALSGAIGGDTVTAEVGHGGGIAGALVRTRQVPASVFGGPIVPRYHLGGVVGSDEVPAILQRGEHVLTAEQARARQSPTVIVNIVNESGAQLQAGSTETEFDGEDVIVNVVVQDIQNGGPIGRAISTADRQR